MSRNGLGHCTCRMSHERYTPVRACICHLPPAMTDRIMLVLIDVQVDFVFPEGTLSVEGAVDDTRRTIDWLYHNVGQITNITATLDSHVPYQIFSPTWWADAEGNHPAPFTPISVEDVRSGLWRPLREPEWSVHYVAELERGGRYALMIWPYHTLARHARPCAGAGFIRSHRFSCRSPRRATGDAAQGVDPTDRILFDA